MTPIDGLDDDETEFIVMPHPESCCCGLWVRLLINKELEAEWDELENEIWVRIAFFAFILTTGLYIIFNETVLFFLTNNF